MATGKYNAQNVLVGASAVFFEKPGLTVAPVLPADTLFNSAASVEEAANLLYNGTLVDDGTPAGDWISAGYTTGGVEVTYTPDFGEVEADQELDAVVMFKQRMSVTVSTTLLEATLDNLLFAWGSNEGIEATATQRKVTISSGELGDSPEERQIAFVGKAPGSKDDATRGRFRLYKLGRALNVESSAHSMTRADATSIPVSMRCLPEGGDYGEIIDFIGPADTGL